MFLSLVTDCRHEECLPYRVVDGIKWDVGSIPLQALLSLNFYHVLQKPIFNMIDILTTSSENQGRKDKALLCYARIQPGHRIRGSRESWGGAHRDWLQVARVAVRVARVWGGPNPPLWVETVFGVAVALKNIFPFNLPVGFGTLGLWGAGFYAFSAVPVTPSCSSPQLCTCGRKADTGRTSSHDLAGSQWNFIYGHWQLNVISSRVTTYSSASDVFFNHLET